jgi:hypothetical protein
MARKSTSIAAKRKAAIKELEELEALAITAGENEKKLLDETSGKIDEICKTNDLFCGAVLTRKDILAILDMAFKTPETESITLKYQLYFNET